MKRHVSRFRMTQGKSGTTYIEASDEALVIPMRSDGSIVFIVEPSAAFEEDVLLLPGGSVEPDESSAEAASRELQEETGYRADRLDYLGEIRPWSKYLRVRSHIYLARDLQESQMQGDEPYVIQQFTAAFGDTSRLIAEGTLRDARVIVALQMLSVFLRHQSK